MNPNLLSQLINAAVQLLKAFFFDPKPEPQFIPIEKPVLMDTKVLKLIRTDLTANGIFGTLQDESGNILAYTAEHSYDGQPKLPIGTYTCVKGEHTLEHHPEPFDAFEVTNVPGHTNILLHIGNYPQVDSEGCILLGEERSGDMVTHSAQTFSKFMALMDNVSSFVLEVS